MDASLKVTSSPHIKGKRTTRGIMLDVIIALLPTCFAAGVIFGRRAFLLIATAVAAAVLSEFLFNYMLKKEQTTDDLSAVVTGILLALSLPVNTPVWQTAIGSVFGIIVVKCIFGGIGKNIVNPAVTARVFMLIAFTNTTVPDFPKSVDAVGGATPLVQIAQGTTPSITDLFLGNIGGAIGETCKLTLILGGIYLVVRRVITWHIPVIYVGSTYIFTLVFGGGNFYTALLSVLSGGLIIAAIYMATDYVTSPSTPWGKAVFCIGAGFLTVIIKT